MTNNYLNIVKEILGMISILLMFWFNYNLWVLCSALGLIKLIQDYQISRSTDADLRTNTMPRVVRMILLVCFSLGLVFLAWKS